MPRYSYNNIIIIVSNSVILEFLSAQFVCPSALQPTLTKENIRITKANERKMKLAKNKKKNGLLTKNIFV